MPIEFKFGQQPVELMVKGLGESSKVTAGDLLLSLNQQKTRIIQRTNKGVDVNGSSFAPYSNRGPFYWYPGKTSKNRKSAAGRAAKKLGGTRTRLGVKFASYGDFKHRLGRTAVDLLGASAPHMLQAMVVLVGGFKVGSDAVSRLIGNGGIALDEGTLPSQPAQQAILGIYGPEADRAHGHNFGNSSKGLPKREFFGFSASDVEAMEETIFTRVTKRMRRYLQ